MRQFVRVLLVCLAVAVIRAEQPKLVVAILVDQLRADYLERFRDQFGKSGFRLFLDKGANMSSANYDYFPTVTGPGHASFLSGAGPAQHGIMGNEWYDRQLRRDIGCVADSDVQGVGTEANRAQASPKRLIGGTLADEMRLHFRSKVVGISIKDRGAILPAGKMPTGAYWFDSKHGTFVTSTYYRSSLPRWVDAFNSQKLPASFAGQSWTRLLDEKFYEYPDDLPGEGNMEGEKRPIFNHVIAVKDDYDMVVTSPFGNELVVQMAKAAVDGENLGRGKRPDLLCVSFSSNDSVGHKFGPYSQEVQDITLRLDRQLEEFFKFLDKRIGLRNVMMVLTADHAVAPAPEFAKTEGFDAYRWNEKKFLTNLVTRLNDRFGNGLYLQTTNFSNGHLFLHKELLSQRPGDIAAISEFVREEALSSGLFQLCYTRQQLLEGRVMDGIGQRVLRGYNAERSGDFVMVPKPYLLTGGNTGTTHGTPYSYDTHIPVIFYGRAFKRGTYPDEFNITDIAPTMAAALRITVPALSIGKPFPRALNLN